MKIRTLYVCLALLAPALAPAGTLYKSVDEKGTVSFSDMPPAGGARILEQRDMAAVGTLASNEPASGLPQTVPPALGSPEAWLDSDAAVKSANAKLDAAERALAEARRGVGTPHDCLRLRDVKLSREDQVRVDNEMTNVKMARRALLDLLQARNRAAAKAPTLVAMR